MINIPFQKHMKVSAKAGFTLVEMIVASSIFTIVMLVVVGSLISLNNESRKSRSIRLVTDNLSSAVDSMSRNMRMGAYYHCGCGTAGTPSTPGDVNYPDGPRDCPMTDALGGGGDQCFAFESQFGDQSVSLDQYVYRLSNHRIQRSKDGGATFIDLTAPEITINDLRFFVMGSTPDAHQPAVTVLIRGTASVTPKIATDFNVQTTLGSRTPNYSFFTP
jgi:prepilin-type N-terminal cleavage/methylation domain-containing protein